MLPANETRPRRRSGFVAAFLSLIFPGLGHAYLGAYRRGLGFAAPPLLLGALIAGFVVRMSQFDLAGMVVQTWFLTGLFVANLIALVYRATAIVDAWSIARALGRTNGRRSDGTRSEPAFRALGGLSVAGLGAVLLVMSVVHLAVARYDVLIAGTADCVFNAGAGGCRSTAPNASSSPGASVGPAATAAAVKPWNGTDRLNILLIGADEQGGAHNTDTMITVSIDPQTRQVVMFTLPRDTVDVPIPPGPARNLFGPTFRGKINSWFSSIENRPDLYPGGPTERGYTGLKAILGNLYGLDIRYYVEVNFRGFEKIVDAVGGVTINVQVPVIDDDYPLAAGHRGRLYIPTGPQHMSGSEALQYARSRHGSTDFDRGARQQRVLVALRQQTDVSKLLPSIDALTSALKESIRTDIPRELVPQLLGLADKVGTRSISSVIFTPPLFQDEVLSSPRGYIIIPHVAQIRAAVKAAFTIDPKLAEARDAIVQEAAKVWVLNGTTRTGEASTLAEYLDFVGMAATAPGQRPAKKGLSATTIEVYNGAEDRLPVTIATLRQIFGVQPVTVTNPSIHVDIVIITGSSTPQLTPPPIP